MKSICHLESHSDASSLFWFYISANWLKQPKKGGSITQRKRLWANPHVSPSRELLSSHLNGSFFLCLYLFNLEEEWVRAEQLCFYGNRANKYFAGSFFEAGMRKVHNCIWNYRIHGLQTTPEEPPDFQTVYLFLHLRSLHSFCPLLSRRNTRFLPFRSWVSVFSACTVCIICAFGQPERVMKSSVLLQELLWSNKMFAVQRRRRKKRRNWETKSFFLKLCWPTPLKAVEGWWWKILGVSQNESCFYPSVS